MPILSEITADYIESFLYKNFSDPSTLLKDIHESAENDNIPIIGPLVGRFLHLLVKMMSPRNVLEIGTAIGYSTIWLASALPKAGKITTIEIDSGSLEIAKMNVQKAGLSSKVKFILGDAAKVVPLLDEKFDLIFLDTAKHLYPKLLPKLTEILSVEGLLIADNTLWGGRVATDDKSTDTLAMKEFDRRIVDDGRLFSIIIPIRDGVSLSFKSRD